MSLAELLPAIRALPRDEQNQLMQLLSEEVNVTKTGADEIPQHLRHVIPPPGSVVDVGFQVTTDQAGFATLQKALDELYGAK